MDPTKLQGMLQQAQEMAQKLQSELSTRKVEGQSGGGMVVALVNGQGDLLSLKIDPSIVDRKDLGMLEDLVIAAVNDAHNRMKELMTTEMQKLTGGFPFPGMGR